MRVALTRAQLSSVIRQDMWLLVTDEELPDLPKAPIKHEKFVYYVPPGTPLTGNDKYFDMRGS